MKKQLNWLIVAAILFSCLAAPAPAIAEGPKLAQVVVLHVEPKNLAAFLERLQAVKAIFENIGLPGFRVWRAIVAGPDTNAIGIEVEYTGLEEFAAVTTKRAANQQWQKWLDEIYESGLARVVSNSLYADITP